MKPYLNIFLLFSTILVFSCTDEGQEFVPALQIESIIGPDQVFEVLVQRTQSIEDNFDLTPWVENAKVRVINNSTIEAVSFYYQGEGIYRSIGSKPLPGLNYELQVSAPGFHTVFATTYVPDLQDVKCHKIEFTAVNDQVTVAFEPNVSKGTENYYAWEFVYDPDAEDTSPGEVSNQTITKPNILSSSIKPIHGESITSEGIIEITGTVDELVEVVKPGDDLNEVAFQDAFVRVMAVSEPVYEYLLNKDSNTNGNHSSITSQNSTIYTNIIGGYGVFGAYNFKNISLRK